MERKTFRERFEDNYKAVSVPANNSKGYKIRYVYYKPWHIWDLSGEGLREKKILLGMLFILGFALYIFAGIQDMGINYDRVVGIATTLSLCAFLYEALGIIQFCVSNGRTTGQNYDDVTSKIMLSTLAQAVLLYIAATGSVTFMMSKGFSARGVLIAAGYCASASLAMITRRAYKEIPLRTEANLNLYDDPRASAPVSHDAKT